MKIENLIEHKKGVKAVKYTSKPRDPNTKTMQGIRSSGAAGAHTDKKRAAKQGTVKHKKQAVQMDENNEHEMNAGTMSAVEGSQWGSPEEILDTVLEHLERDVEWPLSEIIDGNAVKKAMSPLFNLIHQKKQEVEQQNVGEDYDNVSTTTTDRSYEQDGKFGSVYRSDSIQKDTKTGKQQSMVQWDVKHPITGKQYTGSAFIDADGNADVDTNYDNLSEDWQKVNKHDKTDGMSHKAVKAYRREHPGSKLKTAVTTKPSKLKKGSKSAKRRKSFCARMSGMKKAHASAKTKRNPDSPINKALRRWNCESIEDMRNLIEHAETVIKQEKLMEIKKGQKDSNGYTKCWPGKHAEGTKKGKNGKPVRNCVPNEGIGDVVVGAINKVGDALSTALPQDMRPFDNQTAANNAKQQKTVKESIIAEMTRNPDLMSPSDYDRHQQKQMDAERDDFRNRERNAGLDTEPGNNFAVYINGKKWKVFPGVAGYADSPQERQRLRQLQDWAAKKSAATGKKWEVYITGESPTA